MYLGRLLARVEGVQVYKPWSKQLRVSRDVVFDESASCFSFPRPTPEMSEPNSEYEPHLMVEEEIGTQEESPISFRVSRLNERLNDHSDEEPANSGDSAV